MSDITLKRSRAADLLDAVRVMVAARWEPARIEAALEIEFGLPCLEPCEGEAHSNPYIDNCGRCAPRWGWVGPKVRIT